MKRGPQPGAPAKTPFLANARSAWGNNIPDEIIALAAECERTSQTEAAKAIGYSAAAVSHLLKNSYRARDTGNIYTKIRGALMSETVICPVLGEIGKDRCVVEQKRPFAVTNSTRARLYHACKTCSNRHRPLQDGGAQ